MPDARQTGEPFSKHAREDMLFAVGTVKASPLLSTLHFWSKVCSNSCKQPALPARHLHTICHVTATNCKCQRVLPFFAPRGCTDDIPDSEDGPREHSNAPLPDSCLLQTRSIGKQNKSSTQMAACGTPENQITAGVAQRSRDVYRPNSRIGPSSQSCIDPIGRHGVGNTIQRAESVGLHQALAVPYCLHERVIATDCLYAMCMLSKHLRCPSLHRESKHLGILNAAVQVMAELYLELEGGSRHLDCQGQVSYWHP